MTANVNQTLALLRSHNKKVFDDASNKILSELDRKVPVKTGDLKRSRAIRRSYSATSFSIQIEYPTKIADYTDKDTRPHIIRPKRSRVLRFEGKHGIVFTPIVHHPGTVGTRWWTNTVNRSAWQSALQFADLTAGF